MAILDWVAIFIISMLKVTFFMLQQAGNQQILYFKQFFL